MMQINQNGMKWSLVSKLFLVMSLGITLLMVSCEKDNEVADNIAPKVQVEGIEEGDTINVDYSDDGNFFKIELSDAEGLKSNTVTINFDGEAVHTQTKTLTGKQHTDTAFLENMLSNIVYDITIEAIDNNNNSTTFKCKAMIKVVVAYSYLGLVGDATAAGWDISAPADMTVDANNSDLFSYTGALSAGELKIATFSGDWCDGDWIRPVIANQNLSAKSYTITHGCDDEDNKWLVTENEAGDYLITIDLNLETIIFEKK